MTASDPIRAIADAVLYEGYVLWPYRRSALKNTQRWTFGGVYPRAHAEAREVGDDPWTAQTQCLIEGEGSTRVGVGLRFLHIVWRQVVDASGRELDELTVGGERHLTWEEAVEREVTLDALALDELTAVQRVPISIAAGREEEPLGPGGAIVRTWQSLEGSLLVSAERLGPTLHRITARVENTTPWAGGPREAALRRTFCSAHTMLRAQDGGAFVSQTDPPPSLREAAEACENQGTWPVLVGEPGERHTMLVVADHPRGPSEDRPREPGRPVRRRRDRPAPVLNILPLTDEEKAEARASDPRVREILDRSEALSHEELMRLHGRTTRELQVRS